MKNKTALSLVLLCHCNLSIANSSELAEIQVETKTTHSHLLGGSPNVTDHLISGDMLKQKPSTLGNALADELGIHSNQYGGGASAPIIRGQEGKRIKILQNHGELLDMSTMSPDHAITVDTTLARQIEIFRGPTTLLYSSGNAAGAINIVDKKVPESMPNRKIEGSLGFRFNTNNHEKLTYAELTLGAGSQFALHVEGVDRRAENYKTPHYTHYEFDNEKALKAHIDAPDNLKTLEMEYQYWLAHRHLKPYARHRLKTEKHYVRSETGYLNAKNKFENSIVTPQHFDYLPNSWAKSKTGSIGLSWIGQGGYLGIAYTKRQEQYGLPAHNPMYEGCGAYVVSPASERTKSYLMYYPQLMDEEDINYINPRADCLGAEFNSHAGHHHTQHTKSEGSPHIRLVSHRYDLRGEWRNPIKWIEKVRSNLSYTDYQHQEKEGSSLKSTFKNNGMSARFEFSHQPIGALTGGWGLQYFSSKNSAYSPYTNKGRQILNQNKTQHWSLFGLEQFQWNNLIFELSGRVEQQDIEMEYDREQIKRTLEPHPNRYNSPVITQQNKERAEYLTKALEATKPYRERAYSYALGIHWALTDHAVLSLTASHQERLPNAQERYTHGIHLATNSFEVGNKQLNKEKSHNIELALSSQQDQLNYKISGYYYHFDNYIYLQTLNEQLGHSAIIAPYSLRINRYTQAKAKFYGLEGTIGYQFTPRYYAALFGDYIKGRLEDLPNIVTAYDHYSKEKIYTAQNNSYTPRLPPIRLGLRFNVELAEGLTWNTVFYRVFKQTWLAKFEQETPGHNMLNMGLTYRKKVSRGEIEIFLNGNNLLNQPVYAHETFLPYIPQMGRNFNFGIQYKF